MHSTLDCIDTGTLFLIIGLSDIRNICLYTLLCHTKTYRLAHHAKQKHIFRSMYACYNNMK